MTRFEHRSPTCGPPEIAPRSDADDRPPFVEQIWYSAKRHGDLAARAMLGDKVAYNPPVFYNSAKFFDIEYTTVGVWRQ
jgi:hypothetical protein